VPPFLTSLQTRLALLFGKLSHGRASLRSRLKIPSFQGSSHTLALGDPERITKWLGYLLVLMSAWLVLYSLMRIAQLPWPTIITTQASQSSKGMTLYGSQAVQSASALFGSKPVELGNIQLRGVVITGKTADSKDTGFALLEIDGKPSGAVALGENLGKGLVLQAIRPEGATLVHQGQKMDLTLNRSPAKKVNPPPKPSSSNNPSSTSPPAPAASDASKANPS
jgi:hypothetical protein